jgi:hypothetical protein
VQHDLTGRSRSGDEPAIFTFVTGIFGVEAAANVGAEQVWEMWHNRPTGRVVVEKGVEQVVWLE